MSPQESQRVRAKKPKTKAGCRTCKIRRVKCDEGKPFCNRCLKFGADCAGYESPNFKLSKRTEQASMRKIMPRSSHSSVALAPSPTRPPSSTVFQDSREYMCFLHFREQMAIELAGPFNACLWNHVVLQSCQNEPILCRLTASIGALDKATRLRGLSHCEKEANSYEQYSLLKYGQALKGIQGIICTQRQDSVRTALIASLLIYCFENLRGELETAIVHMESALRLMHKQLSHMSRRYQHLQHRSPTPDLEDDIVAAFVRLDNALMSRPKVETPRSQVVVKANILDIDFSEYIYRIPDNFSDMSQARNYLEYFQFQALPIVMPEFVALLNGTNSPEITGVPATDMYRKMSSELQQWNTAFAPLYADAVTPRRSGQTFVAAAMLRVQVLSSNLALEKAFARGMPNSPGIYIHHCCEIIDLSRRVVADPTFRKTFVFDCGIVPGLFIVVATCLDMSIRKEALQVLRNTVPRREGAWDSASLVKLGEMALHMEGGDE